MSQTTQPLILHHEFTLIKGAIEGDPQRVSLEGLGHEIQSARSHRLHRGLDISESGHQNNRRARTKRSQLCEQLEAVLPGHLQIGQHDVEFARSGCRESLGGRLYGGDLESRIVEQLSDHLADHEIVVDYQDRTD